MWSQSAASLAVQVQQILDPLHGRGTAYCGTTRLSRSTQHWLIMRAFNEQCTLYYKLAPQPYRPSSGRMESIEIE